VDVPRVDYEKLTDLRLGEPSSVIAQRVETAREVQRQRFAGTRLACNADMHPAEVRLYCTLDDPCRNLMHAAMNQMDLSARAYHRILKLARTIADLPGRHRSPRSILPKTYNTSQKSVSCNNGKKNASQGRRFFYHQTLLVLLELAV
jgi:predicted ATPase with chaperone activity